MSDSLSLEAAAAQALAARARLADTAHELQSRLAPSRLLDEAVETVRGGASELALTTARSAQRRPRAALALAAVGLVLLVRRPLRRLVRRITGRGKETD